MEALILMTRIPYRGATKTRLMPVLSPVDCEELHEAFLMDYYKCFNKMPGKRKIFIAYAPENFYESFLDSIPAVYDRFSQEGSDIGYRMFNAFEHVFSEGFDKVVLVGCDIPHIRLSTYEKAFEELDNKDIVICPTYDGGYCLIGLKSNYKSLFVNDVTWGNQSVVEKTYTVANDLNLSVAMLDKYRDIDEYEDLIALQRQFNDQGEPDDNRPEFTLNYLEKLIEEKVI